MHEPELCPECDAKSTIAAWLWREEWGADPDDIDAADDAALDCILECLDEHWQIGPDKSATVDAVLAEMATWRPRRAEVH